MFHSDPSPFEVAVVYLTVFFVLALAIVPTILYLSIEFQHDDEDDRP